MKKLNNSNFELLGDIIQQTDFNYINQKQRTMEILENIWKTVVGEKISKYSRVYNILKDDIIIIVCSDSHIAGELYLEKENLIKFINKKSVKMGIKIEDIKFDYKKWKVQNNEKEI